MKKTLIILFLSCSNFMLVQRVNAQVDELAQLALNIEKLAQFKQILSDLKSGYQILFGGYNTIKGISKGNFQLHEAFLDGLLKVSPAVKSYKHVSDIIRYQQDIVSEYKTAQKRFKTSGTFSAQEIGYMENVYTNLTNSSLKNLEDLLTVLSAGKLRISDDERLTVIDKIFADMEDKLLFLKSFNRSNSILYLQRSKENTEVQSVKQFYNSR